MNTGVLRIIDANLNRSREGLRVCEDVSRFILNSAGVSKGLKSMRHGITAAIRTLPLSRTQLLRSRDSREDVGRRSGLATEMRRSSAADIFAANMQRVKESLRVLEELSKLVDASSAARFQGLRFKAYDVEKDAVARLQKLRPVRHTGRGISK
jgi:thiamine-phosphate pyrophosphorylase